jgi:hypothetical protein
MPVPSPEPAELASGDFAGTLTSCHEDARRGTPNTEGVRVKGDGGRLASPGSMGDELGIRGKLL